MGIRAKQLLNLGDSVGWVERSEPHQFVENYGNSWWGSLRSTHPPFKK
jgi:hypothetical protein